MSKEQFRSLVALLAFSAFLTGPIYAEDAKPKPVQEAKPQDKDKGDAQKDEEKEKQPQRSSGRRELLRRMGGMRQPSVYQRSHDKVKEAFRDAVKDVRLSTVRVLADEKQVALGAIVSPEGHVLTKSSQVKGNIECTLSDGQRLPAKLIGRDPKTDLAMLKLNGEHFTTIAWREGDAPLVGSFLATSAPEETPAAIGVVSVGPRKIQAASGILGVLIENDSKGARIDQVMPDSAAEKAGLQVNDVIALFNGTKVEGREALINKVKALPPGTRVRLSVVRGDETLSISATLGDRNKVDPSAQRGNFQNSLGGDLSERRAGFPSVLQHDTVLRPDQCGGPIVDLDGKVVGINIARAGRVESYALPVSVIQPLISQFLAGGLSPDLANKKRIDELNKVIAELQKSEANLLKQIADSEQALKSAQDAETEAQKRADEAIAALKKAQDQAAQAQQLVDKAKSEKAIADAELKSVTSEKVSLEKESQD
ncbi:MAG TPA: trypsin-like peptidase domain-containing protein [Pirellulales bacterium]|nr:trypsin-like peptidase domain-containing protein [Pirellulales bacterium]